MGTIHTVLIKKLEASNAPYFIDITASGALPQTNKLTVLNTSLEKNYSQNNIRLIQATDHKNQEIITY